MLLCAYVSLPAHAKQRIYAAEQMMAMIINEALRRKQGIIYRRAHKQREKASWLRQSRNGSGRQPPLKSVSTVVRN
ncbi:hypothetical protein KQX54_006654 [Cotesia glomerata]|uniref:Uncharacterized protein n=1 Tax=Cotesia glomerata TaxID=32391 RepID=A0AAV7I5M7_COTGL|nr:hypothetical protein KQX54_006654 [Cotesia glomerata]